MGTPSPSNVSTKLQRIAELARQSPQMAFTTLAHHIDIELSARGVPAHPQGRSGGRGRPDGGGVCSGSGGQPPVAARPLQVRHVPGAAGPAGAHPEGRRRQTRPIGIPTFEDKVLQRAVTMVLEAIYEQDFLDCSYGFRPGRRRTGAGGPLAEHDGDGGGWVLEVDIRKFFDHLDHGHLRDFLDQRVRDGVLRRAIDKWLKAGVLEDGCVSASGLRHPARWCDLAAAGEHLPARGAGHVVREQVKPRLAGRASLIRYADDFVIVFTSERGCPAGAGDSTEAPWTYGLTLHPDKTRLIDFRRPPFAQAWETRQETASPWDVRSSGLHPLLGSVPSWELGGPAQDGTGPLQPGTEGHQPLVPVPPPQAGRLAARKACAEAQGSLCVLRDHRERAAALALPQSPASDLAQVAVASIAA